MSESNEENGCCGSLSKHRYQAASTGESKIKVLCGTWNVNAQTPVDRFDKWLLEDQYEKDHEDMPEIYAIACEELVELVAKNVCGPTHGAAIWERRILREINGKARARGTDKYVLVHAEQMVGILLMIYIKKPLWPYVSSTRGFKKPTGKAGVVGNKGGVAISFKLFDTRLCFIGTHLAPHKDDPKAKDPRKAVNKRNQQFATIYEATRFRENSSDTTFYHIQDHNYQFWMGDLNYRLTDTFMDIDKVIAMIEKCDDDYSELLGADELINEMDAGRVFQDGWEEGHITFAPTYKYQIRPGVFPLKYDNLEGGKKRVPAWCDRILYRTMTADDWIEQKFYKRSDMTTSDHVPVSSMFHLMYKNKRTLKAPDQFFGGSMWEVVECFQFSVLMMCLANLADVFQNAWLQYLSWCNGGLHFWEREAEFFTGYVFNENSECVLLGSLTRFGCQFKTHPQNIFLVVLANWLTLVIGSGLFFFGIYVVQFFIRSCVARVRTYKGEIAPLLMYGAFFVKTMSLSTYAILSVSIFQIKALIFYGTTAWGLFFVASFVIFLFFLYLWKIIMMTRNEDTYYEVNGNSIYRSVFGVVLLDYNKEHQWWHIMKFLYGGCLASVVALLDYGVTPMGSVNPYNNFRPILQNVGILVIQVVYFAGLVKFQPYRKSVQQLYISILHFVRIPLIIMSLVYAVLYTEPNSTDYLNYSFIYLLAHFSQLGFAMAWPFFLTLRNCYSNAKATRAHMKQAKTAKKMRKSQSGKELAEHGSLLNANSVQNRDGDDEFGLNLAEL